VVLADYCPLVTAIWGLEGGQWRALTADAYPAEAVLHDLVQDAPQMLPLSGSPQLTVLGREVWLGGNRADLLAVESTGRLVIIEVKLANNAESRRAVVAQVLSYAGYLQGLDAEQPESQVLRAHLAPGGTVLAAAQADDQQQALDPKRSKTGSLAAWPKEASAWSSSWTPLPMNWPSWSATCSCSPTRWTST
jgi:hypothetical protein